MITEFNIGNVPEHLILRVLYNQQAARRSMSLMSDEEARRELQINCLNTALYWVVGSIRGVLLSVDIPTISNRSKSLDTTRYDLEHGEGAGIEAMKKLRDIPEAKYRGEVDVFFARNFISA